MNMKVWNVPVLEELDMKATAYSPDNGHRVDGSYVSKDGKHTYYTYCPSGASNDAE